MKCYKSIVAICICLMLAGLNSCQIFNRYRSPQVDTDGLFRDELLSDTTTIADIAWQDYFPDQYLLSLIDEGLQHNQDLLVAVERIHEAEASLSMARAAYFPDIALVGNIEHTSTSSGKSGRKVLGYSTTQYTLGVSADWELDIWGKLNRQSRAAYARFLNSQAFRNLVQTSLISNIATSYYSLLALDEQLRITNETIVLLGKNVETMQALMDAGLANAASVEQNKALLYETQITVPDLESQIRQLENTICTLLDRKPGPIVRSGIRDQLVSGELAYGVPAGMLARRPDVQQAELDFRAAFEMTNVARASFYPSVVLTSGTVGLGATSLSDFFKLDNVMANLIAGITQPVFSKRKLRGNLKAAKAQQEEALLTFRKTVLSAGQEVSDILYSFQSSLRKNEIRVKQIQSLDHAVDYTWELMKAGEANYLEVISAEQSRLQAKLSQVSDKLEQLRYSVTLYIALGGGLATPEDTRE